MGIDPRKQDLRLGIEKEVKGKSVMGYIMKLTTSVPCPLKPPKEVRRLWFTSAGQSVNVLSYSGWFLYQKNC